MASKPGFGVTATMHFFTGGFAGAACATSSFVLFGIGVGLFGNDSGNSILEGFVIFTIIAAIVGMVLGSVAGLVLGVLFWGAGALDAAVTAYPICAAAATFVIMRVWSSDLADGWAFVVAAACAAASWFIVRRLTAALIPSL